MTTLRICLVAMLSFSPLTLAQDEGNKPSTLWYLPLKLEGTTDGRATFAIGAGFVTPIRENHSSDLGVTLQYQVRTNNGLANLLGLTDAGRALDTRPWTLGVNVSFLDYSGAPSPTRTGTGTGLDQALKDAVNTCSRRCTLSPVPADDQPFCKEYQASLNQLENAWIKDWNNDEATLPVARVCSAQRDVVKTLDADKASGSLTATDWRQKRGEALRACLHICSGAPDDAFCRGQVLPVNDVYATISSTKLCNTGKAQYRTAERDSGATRAFPPLVLNATARVGRTDFQYRTAAPDQPSTLVEATTKAWNWSTGVYVASVIGSGAPAPSLEAVLLLGNEWTASSNNARWCSPAGNIPRGDTFDEAEVCQEAVLGAPTKSRTLRLGGLLGVVDNYESQWRAAVGPQIGLPLRGKSGEQFSVSLQSRLYWSVSSNPNPLKYKGLIRLAAQWQLIRKTDGQDDTRVLVTLALLGDRLLFSENLDDL